MTTERLREIAGLLEHPISLQGRQHLAAELRAHADELDKLRDAALEDAAEIADKHAEHSGNAHGERYTCGEDIAREIRCAKSFKNLRAEEQLRRDRELNWPEK